MNKKEAKEFCKRYDKFKNNNLPTPFWDEERQTLEYVWFKPGEHFESELVPSVNGSLVDALAHVAYTSFYYSYTCGHFTWGIGEKPKYVVGHVHAHLFEEVVRDLYDFPESFSISKDEEGCFSRQELEYLRRVQKYLLFIGLKDIKTLKPSVSRYRNKKHEKYSSVPIRICNNKTIKDFLSGKRNFGVITPDDLSYYEDNPDLLNYQYEELLVDQEDNFIMHIKHTYSEIKEYKDIKNVYKNAELKDTDKVVVEHFTIIKVF
jgi:hypothetical protein